LIVFVVLALVAFAFLGFVGDVWALWRRRSGEGRSSFRVGFALAGALLVGAAGLQFWQDPQP